MDTQVSLDAMNIRLHSIDERLTGIENALNVILELFGRPKIERQEHGKTINDTSDLDTTAAPHDLPSIENDATKDQSERIVQDQEEVNPDAPFSYRALDASKSEIRVLGLSPSVDPSSPIIATLHTISLDEDVYAAGSKWLSYAALSYTWGANVFDGSITLDGKPFAITLSLETALRAMRLHSRDPALSQMTAWPHDGTTPSFWWIDQICINQLDVDERNDQVALMRRIYKRASNVQIWLGDEADDSDVAMDLIQAIGATPTRAPGEKELVYPSFSAEAVDIHWNALEALFKRPWWERAWIRQEVALSNSISLVCGSKSIHMHAIGPVLAAMQYIQSLGWSTSSPPNYETGITLPYTYHANSLLALHNATSGGYAWVDLSHLLPPARSCKATDPRDTVFSILGLCDPEIYPIHADYRQKIKKILTTATRTAITQANCLDLLGTCQNVERKGGLPSWVANLAEPWKALPFESRKDGGWGSDISQLAVTQVDIGEVKVEGECLVVRGGMFDAIELICEDIAVLCDALPEMLDMAYADWQDFVARADKNQQLDEWDRMEFLHESLQLRQMHWVRLLSVLSDDARDLEPGSHEERRRNRGRRAGADVLEIAEQELGDIGSHTSLNLKLSRAYLLPSSSFTPFLPPNRRIHAGLRRNGPGRRLAITTRGFVALVPAESVVGDTVAILQGASFCYVLRKYGGKGKHVLVGEAFVPRYTHGRGETLAKEEFSRSVDEVIRLC